MCFSTRSTLKIIVSFGQLKSVEIVGTQIILHASHQLQILHQSSTNLPECPTLFESASKNSAANRPRRWCITSPALPALGAKSLMLHMERTGKNQEKHREKDPRIRTRSFHL
jgi:PHP family Zn ribbon phosphoesterase